MRDQTILLADASDLVRSLTIGYLNDFGYRVIGAADGQEALDRFAASPADLVLLDAQVPHLDGFEVCRRIRSGGHRPCVPIVFLAGSDDDGTRERAVEVGADDFLSKPVHPTELLMRVRSLLRIHRRVPSAGRPSVELGRQAYGYLLDQSRDAVMLFGLDGQILEANHSAEEQFGYSHAELLTKTVFDLHPSEIAQTVRWRWSAVTQGQSRQLELPCLRADGSLFPAELRETLLELGGRRLILGIARDVTERQRAAQALDDAQRQLRQAQKMEAVGRLAGGIAHDFNNLLCVILGNADFILEKLDPLDPLYQDASDILSAAQRAAGLTKKLLAFSRKQPNDPQPLDLSHAISSIEPLARRVIGEGIELHLVPSTVGPVRMDANQLDQVLMNLIVNARDAMPSGGRLTISTGSRLLAQVPHGQPGKHAFVKVRDTGTGMDQATLEQIFEPFFTTKEPGKGTGLGLSTVFGIIQQSGGHIEVESAPGAGTCFTVYLPELARADFSAQTDGARPAPVLAGRGVLVVEDEPLVRSVTARTLRKAGYRVLEAQNAGEALMHCELHGNQIDLVLTDVVMPRISGAELAERLRTLYPKLPILYMTGYADVNLQHGLIDSSATVLRKPLCATMLTERVTRALEAGQAQAN